MFFASHICWVSSGTVRARYCCDPREVRGANPTMKKWRRGNGMRFTASLRRSELSWPGNLKQQVTPDMVADIKWFKSPTVDRRYQMIQIRRLVFDNQTEIAKSVFTNASALSNPEKKQIRNIGLIFFLQHWLTCSHFIAKQYKHHSLTKFTNQQFF